MPDAAVHPDDATRLRDQFQHGGKIRWRTQRRLWHRRGDAQRSRPLGAKPRQQRAQAGRRGASS